jgi:hypothetical protein
MLINVLGELFLGGLGAAKVQLPFINIEYVGVPIY